MIRAVIDTNLLVSYALTKGQTLSRLVNHWKRGSFIYLASPMIIEELKEVLQRPHLRAKMIADPQPLLDVVEADTEQILGQLVLEGVCRDPKDAIFIACAVEDEDKYTNLEAANLEGADLSGAKYNDATRWPEGFDPIKAGAIRRDNHNVW